MPCDLKFLYDVMRFWQSRIFWKTPWILLRTLQRDPENGFHCTPHSETLTSALFDISVLSPDAAPQTQRVQGLWSIIVPRSGVKPFVPSLSALLSCLPGPLAVSRSFPRFCSLCFTWNNQMLSFRLQFISSLPGRQRSFL